MITGGEGKAYQTSITQEDPVTHRITLDWASLQKEDIGCSGYEFILRLNVENSVGSEAYFYHINMAGKNTWTTIIDYIKWLFSQLMSIFSH